MNNTTHPASLAILKDNLSREGRHTLETTLGTLTLSNSFAEGLVDAEFSPADGKPPVRMSGLYTGQADALGWLLCAADSDKKKHQWKFLHKEHRKGGTLSGILTDGIRFLFFRTWSDPDTGAAMCGIYESIQMEDGTEVCRYEWTPENDEILIDCLNALEDPDDYRGEDSPLRTLVFRNIREENLETGNEAARLLLDREEYLKANYDPKSDTLHLAVRKGTLGLSPLGGVNESVRVNLCPDFGYYLCTYETSKGPLTYGGMFGGGDDLAEEIAGYPFFEIKEPDWLVPILKACTEAGRDPSHLFIDEVEEKGKVSPNEGTVPTDTKSGQNLKLGTAYRVIRIDYEWNPDTMDEDDAREYAVSEAVQDILAHTHTISGGVRLADCEDCGASGIDETDF